MLESNKDLVRRWIEECVNRRNADITDEILAVDIVCHEPSVGSLKGRDAIKQMFIIDWLAAFPDLRCAIDAQVEEGDRVATHLRWSGTQVGEFLGVAASGKNVEVQSVIITRASAGKIAEMWEVWDALGFFRQIGAVSAEAEARKKLVRRHMEEVWNRGEFDALAEIFTEDCHFLALHSAEFVGLEPRRQFVLSLRNAMPDIRFTMDELISDGEVVVQRWSCVGTHRGEIFGLAPTGNVVPGSGTTTYHFRDGKICEELIQWDALGFMRALGAIPAGTQAAAFVL